MAGYRAKPPKGATLNRADPLSKGLVGAWLFNEGAGPRAQDSARGKAGDGTLTNFGFTGSSGWVSSEYGKALQFDGSDDYVSVGPPGITSAGGWTLAALVRRGTGANRGIVTFSNGSAAGSLFINDVHRWTWSLTSDAGSSLANIGASGGGTAGQWYTLHATYDPASGSVLYVDGVSAGTSATTGTVTAGTSWRVGSFPGYFFWDGRIAGAWVWNRPLSASAIRRHRSDPFRMFRRRNVPVPAKPAGGTFGDGYGSISGVGAAGGVGSSLASAVAGATGAASGSGGGSSLLSCAGGAAGIGVASGAGSLLASGAGSAAGAGVGGASASLLSGGAGASSGAAGGVGAGSSLASGVGVVVAGAIVSGIGSTGGNRPLRRFSINGRESCRFGVRGRGAARFDVAGRGAATFSVMGAG